MIMTMIMIITMMMTATRATQAQLNSSHLISFHLHLQLVSASVIRTRPHARVLLLFAAIHSPFCFNYELINKRAPRRCLVYPLCPAFFFF